MTSMLLIISGCLVLMLATPDSVSQNSELGLGARQGISLRPQSRHRSLLARDAIRLSQPALSESHDDPMHEIPNAGQHLCVSHTTSDEATICAARNDVPPTPKRNREAPLRSFASIQRAAMLTPSGREMVENLRSRRHQSTNIATAYRRIPSRRS